MATFVEALSSVSTSNSSIHSGPKLKIYLPHTANKHILTAAHCADGVLASEVVIGAHDIRDPNNKIIKASPIVYPEWDPYTLSNDIAIYLLEEDIIWQDYNGTVRCVKIC